eukprot:1159964-Pelagomonas_calceolata.AAC.7
MPELAMKQSPMVSTFFRSEDTYGARGLQAKTIAGLDERACSRGHQGLQKGSTAEAILAWKFTYSKPQQCINCLEL